MGLGLDWNRFVSIDDNPNNHPFPDQTIIRNMQLRGELFQRVVIRLWGINWDLGVYGGLNAIQRIKTVNYVEFMDENNQLLDPQPYDNHVTTLYKQCKSMNLFEYGAMTRISYCVGNTLNIGIYGTYRLSPVFTKDDPVLGLKVNNPSPWNVGIEFELVP